MISRTSPFYDRSLICSENYEPVCFSNARVETRTFIELLKENMNLNGFEISERAINNFFDCYDETLVKIAEADRAIKDPERFHAKVAHLSDSEIEEKKLRMLRELGRREESIRVQIEKLQSDLYDATKKRNNTEFSYFLVNATSELKRKVDYLYELVEQTD